MRVGPCFTLVCLCRCFLCFFNSIVKRLQRQHELQCFDIHQTVNITLLLKKLKCWFNQLSKWFPVFITERMLDKFDQSREGYTILTWKRKRDIDIEGFFTLLRFTLWKEVSLKLVNNCFRMCRELLMTHLWTRWERRWWGVMREGFQDMREGKALVKRNNEEQWRKEEKDWWQGGRVTSESEKIRRKKRHRRTDKSWRGRRRWKHKYRLNYNEFNIKHDP